MVNHNPGHGYPFWTSLIFVGKPVGELDAEPVGWVMDLSVLLGQHGEEGVRFVPGFEGDGDGLE